MNRKLHTLQAAAYRLADLVSDAIFETQRPFQPRSDRLRYNVHPQVLATATANDLPAPAGPYESWTLVSSKLTNGNHAPLLDLDAVGAVLVPSSTEGNFHLYLEGIELSWREYRRFLRACQRAGLITPGYLKHSIRREQTSVRRPGSRKLPQELGRKSNYDVLNIELDTDVPF